MVASGMGHMTVKRQGDRAFTMISNEPAASGCMPSVDPMLRSLATAYDGHVLAVILSGMGRDGAIGAEHLAAAGGTVMAQDAARSEEPTSELQSLMRISYAGFCLNTKQKPIRH